MAEPGFPAQPPGVPPPVTVPPAAGPPRKVRSGWRVVLIVAVLFFVVCVAADSAGAWYWWQHRPGNGDVGQCFPAGRDGPLDTSHGPVSCANPNAIWKITKVIDGRANGDVIGTCGTDGDALIYIAEKDQSYCLDYIN